MKLPEMTSRSSLRPSVQTAFGGLNHNLSAGDGELYAMKNLSGREFPLLTPRLQRGLLTTLSNPGGIGAGDEAWWADGTGFYYGGVRKGTVTAGAKTFAAMGRYILIFPDKKYYDAVDDVFGSMEESWQGSASFCSGTYAGVYAAANTIRAAGAEWSFRPGDALTVSGCRRHEENNKTLILREAEGDELRFDENALTLDRRWVCRSEDGTAAGTYHFTPEDFYVYLVAHEYKHYVRGGTGLRSLLDVYVFLRRMGDSLDRDYIRRETDKLNITEFETQTERSLSGSLTAGRSPRKMRAY